MIAVLLVKNSAVNLENKTANMHIDARDIGERKLEQSLIDRGFILMTEAEWETHLATFKAEYQAWELLQSTTKETGERTRMDAFKQLLQDGRAIDQNWAGATNAQKLELGRINFRILWLARTSLAELVKPEAS
jgi:hypothetical protein